jgi:hypothetical protein
MTKHSGKTRTIALFGHDEQAFKIFLAGFGQFFRDDQSGDSIHGSLILVKHDTRKENLNSFDLLEGGKPFQKINIQESAQDIYITGLGTMLTKFLSSDDHVILLTGLKGGVDTWLLYGFLKSVRDSGSNVEVHCMLSNETNIKNLSVEAAHVWDEADRRTICGCSAQSRDQQMVALADEILTVYFSSEDIDPQICKLHKPIHLFSPAQVLRYSRNELYIAGMQCIGEAVLIDQVFLRALGIGDDPPPAVN